MQPAVKRNESMHGFAPRIHPRQACSLDCIAKLRFAFQQALQAIQSRQTFRGSRQAHFRCHPATIFRQPSSFLQSKSQSSTSQHLPSGSPGQHPPVLLLYRANLSLPSANTLPSGSSGQHSPAAHLSIPGLTTFHKPVHDNSRQM